MTEFQNVLLVDERRGLHDHLASMWTPAQGLRVVAQAANMAEALHGLDENDPDIVLVGAADAPEQSLEVVRQIRSLRPGAILGVLSSFPHLERRFIFAGADYVFPLLWPEAAAV